MAKSMAKSPQVATQSVSTTKMALATLAMVAAAGASLVAVPANNLSASPRAECIPMNIEFSQPCTVAVRGQAETFPGFQRMRYVCPGVYDGRGVVSVGSCRTQTDLYNAAAVYCQRNNLCALAGYGYGEIPPQPPENVNVPQAVPPTVSFADDTPSQLVGPFSPTSTAVLAKVVVSNPNNAAMTIRGMGWALAGNGVSFVTSSNRTIDVASADIYSRGVNARVNWVLPNRFTGVPQYFDARGANFSSLLIPARGSKVVYFNANLQSLVVPGVSNGVFSFDIRSGALDWSVGAFASSSYPQFMGNYGYRIINVSRVLPPMVSWASDTPSGAAVPSPQQVIGKIIVSNSDRSQEDLMVEGISLQLQTRFSRVGNNASSTLKIYRDGMGGALIATVPVVLNRVATQDIRFAQPVAISRQSSKNFIVTLDTSGASANDNVLISVNDLSWSIDGNRPEQGVRLLSLPLMTKVFTY